MTVAIDTLGEAALELRIRGKLRADDYHDFVPMLEGRIREHGKVNLLVHVLDFEGWTPTALWEDLKFDVRHYQDVRRIALVAEDASKEWLAKISKPFTGGEVRFFPEAELDAARRWIREGAGD